MSLQDLHNESALAALCEIGLDTDLIERGADAAGMTVVAFVTQQLEGAARAVLDGRKVAAIPTKAYPPSSLPTSVAGRIEVLDGLLRGLPILDAEGRYTGERTAPMITREQYARLAGLPKIGDDHDD